MGQVVLEIIENWPEAYAVIHGVLRSGLQSMKIATLTIETVDGETQDASLPFSEIIS